MYKIIGADGKEYGPATADQVRQWIREGRVNRSTRVWNEAAGAWKALREVPDLAAIAEESLATHDPWPVSASGLPARRFSEPRLRVGHCFSRAFALVFENFPLTVGVTLVVTILTWAIAGIPFAGLFFSYVLWGGLDWMFLRLIRGEPAGFEDAFIGFSDLFVPLMLFSAVSQSLVLLGSFFCIVPGIFLAVLWLVVTPLLIVDRRLDFWPAMRLAGRVVLAQWWRMLGLCILCVLLLLAGAALCGVGLLIALPVTTAATVYAYEELFPA